MSDTFPEKGQYLDGRFLVATTQIQESCFYRCVIYLCVHSAEGAMGMIVNHVLPDIDYREIMEQLKIDVPDPIKLEHPVYLGGPVEAIRGLVIHSPDYEIADTQHLAFDIAVTANLQVLRDIAEGKGPKKHLLTLGYAGWAPGQLEAEIEANSWISVDADAAILFDTKNEEKWERAADSVGVDMFKLSGDVGHA